MTNRLGGAISPYLRSHADNPVDWRPWSEDAFAEAVRRDVPILISIGYSTCHWCHVMARESFSDPDLAAYLNDHFVAVKVDREEHPDVDAGYLAAAAAFTRDLGWPLNVFGDTGGRAFFAGTYFPPAPVAGHASFRQVLEAVVDAWTERRSQVESTAAQVAEAIDASRRAGAEGAGADGAGVDGPGAEGAGVDGPGADGPGADGAGIDGAGMDGTEIDGAVEVAAAVDGAGVRALPSLSQLEDAARSVALAEDRDFGGFGSAPKFPVAPLLAFLLGEKEGAPVAVRALRAMASAPLRDPVEGGFFRYATRRDWSEPHYERMLYDNALLLDDYTTAWRQDPQGSGWAAEAAEGIARFLGGVLQLPDGGFASAQDSESQVEGRPTEGEYYLLSAGERAAVQAPALDRKVLTGWNGLAIGALARSGFAFGRTDWLTSARRAADRLLAHVQADRLVRASDGERMSDARATLEDFGGLADGLLALATATGQARYAVAARELVDRILASDPAESGASSPFLVPDGGDPVLSARGLGAGLETTDGAVPSGLSLAARASYALFLLTDQRRYCDAAESAIRVLARQALATPMAHGSALALAHDLRAGPTQLVLVVPEPHADDRRRDQDGDHTGVALESLVRRGATQVSVIVSGEQARQFAEAGFALFEGRSARGADGTAYLCRDFVCALPVETAGRLRELLGG